MVTKTPVLGDEEGVTLRSWLVMTQAAKERKNCAVSQGCQVGGQGKAIMAEERGNNQVTWLSR